jgi:hypothetical protein
LAILLGCLLAATALAIAVDQAREAYARAELMAEPGETKPASGTTTDPLQETETSPITTDDLMVKGMMKGASPELVAKAMATLASDTRMAAGSEAPDFTLPDASGRLVSLNSCHGGRPIVVVFGSFGCDEFCDQLDHLRTLRDAYQDSADFLFVYVSEAPHTSSPLAKSAHSMPPPGDDVASRLRRVAWYEEEAGAGLTWLLDGEDERTEKLYNGWPRRLVIVGADGRVAFDAGHGLPIPWNMSEVEKELKAAIATSQAAATSHHPAGHS